MLAVEYLNGNETPGRIPETGDQAAHGEGDKGTPQHRAVAVFLSCPCRQKRGSDHDALGNENCACRIDGGVDIKARHCGLAEQWEQRGVAEMEEKKRQAETEEGRVLVQIFLQTAEYSELLSASERRPRAVL